MKKRFLAIMLLLCMMFSTTANARMNITGNSLPEGWTTDLSDNAQISVNDGIIRTEYNADNATGKADVISKPFAVNDSIGFYVNCTFNISGVDSRTYRTIQLTDGKTNTNLISIKNTQLTAFGKTLDISENTDIKTNLWVNTNTGTVVLKVNDAIIFSGVNDDLNSVLASIDLSMLSIKFRNYRALKGTITAVSELSDMEIDTIGKYKLTSNVDNGGSFNAGEETSLKFNFGIPVSDEIAQKTNISFTLNDEAIEFESLYDGENLIITPQNGFSDFGKYKVVISEAKSIFGNTEDSNIEFEVTVTDSSYVKPEITVKASKTYAKVGENVEISAEAVTSQTKTVKIFVNNECVTEGTENNLTYILSRTEGTYEVYAEVTDTMDIIGRSDTITVVFEENDVPEITVEGLSDVYSGIDGEEITISSTDKDGIDRMEVYLNDILYYEGNTSEKTIDISKLYYGKYTMKIIAYDTTGLAGTKTIEFSVIGAKKDLLYTDDFSDYSSTEQLITLKSGILLAGQRGYVKPDVIDEAHGNSLIVGMDTVNPGFNDGDRPYVGISLRNCISKHTLMFDIYIDHSPERASPGSFTLKQNGGAEVEFATVSDGAFHFKGADVPFETNKWYTFSVEVDVLSHKYSISINDGTSDKKVVSDVEFTSALTNCHYVRIGGPTNDSVKTSYALDNVRVYRESDFPVITQVGYNGIKDAEQIICNPDTIDIYLSTQIKNIVKEQVTISDNGAPVIIENVLYDANTNCVKVTLKHRLRSNTLYKITLAKGIKMTDDTEIDRNIESSFITALEGTDIVKASYTGGSIEFDVQNNTGDSEKLYAVVAVYNGDKFVRSAYAPIEAKAETTIDGTINIGTLSNGETAELYLWKVSDGTIRTMSSKIYCFK